MNSLSRKNHLFKQKRFRYLLAILILVSLFLGVIIVPIERSVGQITTTFDGIWWATQTITTVGYGDMVPVTDAGRVVGIVLQVVGAVIFGIVVAIIGHSVSHSQEEFYWNRVFERLDRLESEIAQLKKQTSFIVKDQTDTKKTTHLI